jgi:hypothetical protein
MGGVGMLIERDAELAMFVELSAAARAGRGGAIFVEGEAGIGKTRLLARAREEAGRAGVRVLYAAADEIEAAVPLGAARVLLGRAARGIGAVERIGSTGVPGLAAQPIIDKGGIAQKAVPKPRRRSRKTLSACSVAASTRGQVSRLR